MLRDRFFRLIFGSVVLIAALHYAGIYGGLYGAFIWFDILTHFLGGVTVGGLGLWILLKTSLRKRLFGEAKPSRARILVLGLAVAFLVGIGWEIFEALTDPFLRSEARYASDVISDLIADSAGGLSAAFLFLLNHKS